MSRRGWLAAYVAATLLSFPHAVGEGVLDLGRLAGWLGPAFLVLGLRGLGPRRAAAAGFGAGLAAHALVFHWIYVVTVTYGHAPPPIGVVAAAGLAVYPACFVAAFAAGAARLARGAADALPSPWPAAALWAALDHGRSFVLTGFPWALLGYTQHQNPPLLALAPYTGVFGLSAATALGGLAAARAGVWGLRARRAGVATVPRGALGALATVALLHVAGALVLARDAASAAAGARLRVGVLQGNVDQGVKWSPAWAVRTLEDYEALTHRAAAEGAQVVVWPETAVPASPDASAELVERLGALARETRAALVVGAVGMEDDRDAGRTRYFDSAYLFDPEGVLLARYDKAHLVPFGEYVPLRGVLGHFVEALARGVADTDVSPGQGPRALVLPTAPGPGQGEAQRVTAGVPICYELLFPDLVRRFVGDGAEALLAITNDAWYGRTGAPYQFLAITALRSAENRVWTARAANTGVSALIDDRGRVRARTRIFERGHLVADIELRPAPQGGSFYTRHGDWFAAGCWAASALALVRAGGRRGGEGR